MESAREFETLIMDIIGREAEEKPHAVHPRIETFLAAMTGDLSREMRTELVSHVATCGSCSRQWKELANLLRREAEGLDEQADVLTLRHRVRLEKGFRRRTSVGERLSRWARSLLPESGLRPVLLYAATAAAAVAITLTVAVPRIASLSTADALEIKQSLASLEEQLGDPTLVVARSSLQLSGGQLMSSFPVAIEESADVDPATVQAIISIARVIEDPWHQAVFISSELQKRGVVVPTDVDFTGNRAYLVQDGDSWQSIAQEQLGSEALWPVLWLFNAGRDSDGLDSGVPAEILLPITE